MIKIDIISGFLGAGKTTLIKKLIAEALKGEKLVLIENEFGEIGIDGGFLKDSGIQITEMNSGCICCTLVGDFTKSLNEVIEKYSPDRIIIEPSGVGKLSDVITAVKEVNSEREVEIKCFTTVADASKYKMYMKAFGEFYNNQIEFANTIILSRTQNISEDKLNECVSAIRKINEEAVIITTPWDDIDGVQIMKAIEHSDNLEQEMLKAAQHEHHHDENCTCGCHHHHDDPHHHHHDDPHHHHDDPHHHHDDPHHHHHDDSHHHHHDDPHHHHDDPHHHHHHADEAFSSWGVETPKKFKEENLRTILGTLSETEDYGVILRAKGIIPSIDDGDWFYFDLVPGEVEIRRGKPDYTGKLCVIGAELHNDGLANLFGI